MKYGASATDLISEASKVLLDSSNTFHQILGTASVRTQLDTDAAVSAATTVMTILCAAYASPQV